MPPRPRAPIFRAATCTPSPRRSRSDRAGLGEFPPGATDLHGYGRVVGVALPAEHRLAYLRAAHDLPGVAREVLADGVLGGRERHGLATHGEVARPEVDPHLPEGEGVRARPALTA